MQPEPAVHYSWYKVTVVSVIWGKELYWVCLPQLSLTLTNTRVQWHHAFFCAFVVRDFNTARISFLFVFALIGSPHFLSHLDSFSFKHFQSCICWSYHQLLLYVYESCLRCRGVCVCACFRVGGGGLSRARGDSWAEAHDFFILLIILPGSDPFATSTALLLIIHTASLYINQSFILY